MKYKFLFLILFASITYTSYSQDVWSNLTLPPTLNTPITSYAVSGNDFYLGTNGQGVFYTNDSGQTWSNNTPQGQMFSGPITKILISLYGPVFAIGSSSIYRTQDKASNWDFLPNFPYKSGNIQCAAISPQGSIAVGMNTGIVVSLGDANGNSWQNINGQMGPFDVKSIIFNMNEQIFFSGIYRELLLSILQILMEECLQKL